MKKLFFLLLIGILFVNFISAIPPAAEAVKFNTGYTIIQSPQQEIKENSNHTFNFAVHNSTTGGHETNTTVNCSFFLQNWLGQIIIAGPPIFNSEYDVFYYPILSGNFSEVGQYNYFVRCLQYPSETFGGDVKGSFLVTPGGNFGDSFQFYILALIILIGIVLLGFSIKEHWFVVLGGLGFMILGVWTLNNGVVDFKDMFMAYSIAIFEIAVGAILAIGAGIQKLDYD